MTDNEIIDKLLDVMSDKEQHSVHGQIAVHFHLVDGTHDRIRERMIRKGLIEPYTKDGEIITDFGMDVIDAGGWISYISVHDETFKFQQEKAKLELDKLRADRPRFWLTWGLALVVAISGGYSIYQTRRTNTLEQELKESERQKDSVVNVTTNQTRIQEMKDEEILKIKSSRDSLAKGLRPEKKGK